MNIQETVVLRIKRERGSHLATNYGPIATKNYSHIIGEAPMDMMKPSVMLSRLDLVFVELAAAGIDFGRLP